MLDDAPPDSNYSYHYRKFFGESDAGFLDMSNYYAAKLGRLNLLKPGNKILEVGCGWGFCLGGLQKLGIIDIEGIDIDPAAVHRARKRGLNASLLSVLDIHNFMASRINTYDAILAFDVLEHVPLSEQMGVLRDIRMALKEGGVFICQVPNADSVIASHMRYVDYTHVISFTSYSLDSSLHNAGFQPAIVVDADPIERPPLREWNKFKFWIVKRFMRILLRLIYLAELGAERKVWEMPLDKNIIGVARR